MSRGPDPQIGDVLAQQISGAPFRPGQRVNVPGRYNRMVVERVWRGSDVGDWHIQAVFESGYGMYVGYAHEFKDGWT